MDVPTAIGVFARFELSEAMIGHLRGRRRLKPNLMSEQNWAAVVAEMERLISTVEPPIGELGEAARVLNKPPEDGPREPVTKDPDSPATPDAKLWGPPPTVIPS